VISHETDLGKDLAVTMKLQHRQPTATLAMRNKYLTLATGVAAQTVAAVHSSCNAKNKHTILT